jgi:hypothetical protein
VDDETDWQRQLLIGLVVLVAVGALIGGIVAVVSIKAADLAGIDDTPATTGPFQPGQSRDTDSEPGGATSSPNDSDPSTGSSGGPSTTGSTRTEPADTGLVLNASPEAVSTYERINLSGTYEAPTGTLLQVQRKENGAWINFPVDPISLSGGKYATYVETGHTGVNTFRILAVARDEASNPVRVQVG